MAARAPVGRALLSLLACLPVGADAAVREAAVRNFYSRHLAAQEVNATDSLDHGNCEDMPLCASLGSQLRQPWEQECRYPAAEFCPRSCGHCGSVLHARQCQLPADGCPSVFRSSVVDWEAFFNGMLSRAEGLVHKGGGKLLSKSPWLAEFPHFFSEREADMLAAIGEGLDLEQEDSLPKSVRDVMKRDCESPECLLDPLIGEVYRRTSELLGVPMGNFESMEFLVYGPGQHYLRHPDAMPGPLLRITSPEVFRSGQRVLTVFFYFTDVEDGGETTFPNAGLKVKATKGKMVVWSNVNPDMWRVTAKAEHQALPVKKGKKIAANFWVHPTNFRIPEHHSRGNPICDWEEED